MAHFIYMSMTVEFDTIARRGRAYHAPLLICFYGCVCVFRLWTCWASSLRTLSARRSGPDCEPIRLAWWPTPVRTCPKQNFDSTRENFERTTNGSVIFIFFVCFVQIFK